MSQMLIRAPSKHSFFTKDYFSASFLFLMNMRMMLIQNPTLISASGIHNLMGWNME